jgi:hypothetical protein
MERAALLDILGDEEGLLIHRPQIHSTFPESTRDRLLRAVQAHCLLEHGHSDFLGTTLQGGLAQHGVILGKDLVKALVVDVFGTTRDRRATTTMLLEDVLRDCVLGPAKSSSNLSHSDAFLVKCLH